MTSKTEKSLFVTCYQPSTNNYQLLESAQISKILLKFLHFFKNKYSIIGECFFHASRIRCLTPSTAPNLARPATFTFNLQPPRLADLTMEI